MALTNGTRNEHLRLSLDKNPPKTMAELQRKVGKYITVEETLPAKEAAKGEDRKRRNDDGGNRDNGKKWLNL